MRGNRLRSGRAPNGLDDSVELTSDAITMGGNESEYFLMRRLLSRIFEESKVGLQITEPVTCPLDASTGKTWRAAYENRPCTF